MSERQKYNYMENALQVVNRYSVSLNKPEVKRNNRVLKEVLQRIIEKMKRKDTTFASMYTRVFYGGSYYDGLKVKKPDEFDLDLLMSLPKDAAPTLTLSEKKGFVRLQLKEFTKWQNRPEAKNMPFLGRLLDENYYLETTKVSSWIEGIVTKVLNDFQEDEGRFVIGRFYASVRKSGPAHTLRLESVGRKKKVRMDVDLVPCFEFTSNHWPRHPFRRNPRPEKPNFFIVPKKPPGSEHIERYWRLSFQEQERALLIRKLGLKPAARLLKQMRDTLGHPVPSYYIKTVFLWLAEQDTDGAIWSGSLSYVFMTMLKLYKQMIDEHLIPYFWNREHKLLANISEATRQNISDRLRRVIQDIENNLGDPLVVVKYLVPIEEVDRVKSALKKRT